MLNRRGRRQFFLLIEKRQQWSSIPFWTDKGLSLVKGVIKHYLMTFIRLHHHLLQHFWTVQWVHSAISQRWWIGKSEFRSFISRWVLRCFIGLSYRTQIATKHRITTGHKTTTGSLLFARAIWTSAGRSVMFPLGCHDEASLVAPTSSSSKMYFGMLQIWTKPRRGNNNLRLHANYEFIIDKSDEQVMAKNNFDRTTLPGISIY